MNNYNNLYIWRLEKKNQLFTSREKLVLLMLLLSSMDFYLYGRHIMIFAFLVYCAFAGRVHYVKGVGATILLSTAILFFTPDALNGPSTMTRWLVWPMAFLLGYEMTAINCTDESGAEKLNKRVNYYMLIISAGFFIHFALNFYFNKGQTDLGRNTNDFWSKDIKTATGQAAAACIPLGWCVASFINNTNFLKKIPSIIGLVIIFQYNLTLSTRTIFVMMLLVAIVAVLYLILSGEKAQKKTYTVLVILAVLFAFVMAYQSDMFNLQSNFEDSGFYDRFFTKGGSDITEDSRWENKKKFLELAPLYIWGGGRIRRRVGTYAHDLFLDTHDEAGVLALVAVIMIVGSSIRVLIRLLKNKQIRFETRMTVLCIFSALYMEFMVEPILAGMSELLMAFCFFCGMNICMNQRLGEKYSARLQDE